MSKPTLEARLAVRDKPINQQPIMNQKWRNLLFLHWEYDADEIQKTLPKGLYVDQFKKKAYIGITPFFMKDVRLTIMPALPGVSDFMEMNVRTYVYDEKGVPGVWFYSLDANSLLGVQTAKSFFYLPYFYADMESRTSKDNEIYFRCLRKQTAAASEFIYKGTGETVQADPHSLEFFLMERYVLFADKGNNQIFSGRVHHAPYPIEEGQVSQWSDWVFEMDGLKRPKRAPDHVHFSPGVNVEVFNLERLS